MNPRTLILTLLFFSNQVFCESLDESFSCIELSKAKGIYIEAIGGASHANKKQVGAQFYPGYYAGGVVGYKFSNRFKLEGELSYQRANIRFIKDGEPDAHLYYARGHLKTCLYMINLLTNFDFSLPFVPYFGSGCGYARNDGKWSGSHSGLDQHTTFKKREVAFQGIMGVKYRFRKAIEVGIDYRYILFGRNEKCQRVGLALTGFF